MEIFHNRLNLLFSSIFYLLFSVSSSVDFPYFVCAKILISFFKALDLSFVNNELHVFSLAYLHKRGITSYKFRLLLLAFPNLQSLLPGQVFFNEVNFLVASLSGLVFCWSSKSEFHILNILIKSHFLPLAQFCFR